MSQDDMGLRPVDRARRYGYEVRATPRAPRPTTPGLVATLALVIGIVLATTVAGAVLGAVGGGRSTGWTAETLMRLDPPGDGTLSPQDSDRAIQSELVVLTGPQVRAQALASASAPDDATVEAVQDGLTDFVTVSATAADAATATALANAVPTAYVEVQQAAAAAALTEQAEGLATRLQTASDRLAELEAEPDGTVVEARRQALTALVQQLASQEQDLSVSGDGAAPGLQVVLPATSAEPQEAATGPVPGALLGAVVGLALAALLAGLLRRRSSSAGSPPADDDY